MKVLFGTVFSRQNDGAQSNAVLFYTYEYFSVLLALHNIFKKIKNQSIFQWSVHLL